MYSSDAVGFQILQVAFARMHMYINTRKTHARTLSHTLTHKDSLSHTHTRTRHRPLPWAP